jgi:hypothetical protein
VPRTRSPEIQKRNDEIYSLWLRGASLTALAAENGIARQVVGRIVASYHPEEGEDDDRALYRGYMWRLYDEVQLIGDSPGWKMRPDGNPAYGPDDEVALDTNVQVQAKELQLKILRELRILDARDKHVAKEVRYSLEVADQARLDDIARRKAEMEQLSRQAGAVPEIIQGEIEPPPEPS